VKAGKFHACLNFHIHRCAGPCEGHIDRKEYLWYVDQLSAFIRGQNRELIRDLERRMREYSKAMRFEDAARMRDLLQSVSTFYAKQKVASGSIDDRDILATAMGDDAGIGVAFNVRGGKLIQRRQFALAGTDTASPAEALAGFLEQYYMHTDDVPPEVLLSDQVEDLEATALWLTGKRGKKVRVFVPQKGGKADLTIMAAENARLILEELRLQKAGVVHEAASVLALQKDLALEKPPMRIEAFDISNLFGQEAVASMVYFENGQPKKSQYRRFKIRTVEGIDDFKMMAEAVERRFSRLSEEGGGYPDLLLVDGGKGQLSATVEVLQRLGIPNQPVIGLAKRLEEIFRPGISDPQTLPKTSPSLHLLQRVRDEAHRFAVKYHRTLRDKDAVVSVLDGISGIGPKRRQELLKHFGSLEGIRQASEEDLAKVKGMNKASAKKVWEALHKNGI
jgi:excinuclease ABC subunit C